MFVIKYGGSRVFPNETGYDNSFVDSLASMVRRYPQEKFMVVIGGGYKARMLQSTYADDLGKQFNNDPDLIAQAKDLLGIRATRENAAHVIGRFQQLGVDGVCPKVIFDPFQKAEGDYRIYFAGGYRPGNSTDYVTMVMAHTYGAEKVIKISDFPIVKKISPLSLAGKSKEEMKTLLSVAPDLPQASWKEMVDMVGTKWIPGLNTPLDPPAAAFGLEHRKMCLYICPESQLEAVLAGNEQHYTGTVVRG